MDFDSTKKLQEIQATIDNLKNGLKPDDRIPGKLVIGFCDSLILSIGYVRAALSASAPAPVDGELLPCPFCGGEAEVRDVSNNRFVACCKRGCVNLPYGGFFTSEKAAIEIWNSRATLHPAKGEGCEHCMATAGKNMSYGKGWKFCPWCGKRVGGAA